MEKLILLELAAKRFFGLGLFLHRKVILELCRVAKSQEDHRHVLQLELDGLRQMHDRLVADHARQKKGVGTLLQFIHSTHRLNLPVAEGTILEAIRKGQIK